MKYLSIFTIGCLLFPLLASASAGGSVGGGGADTILDAAAWFTDSDLSRPVHVCIQADSQFGVNSDKLKSLVKNAFGKWVSYYEKTGAKERSANANEWTGCSMDGGETYRKGFRIATQMQLQDACDGTEDLTVYFGVSSPDLELRRADFISPYAFAELRDPFAPGTHQKAWSKGLISIAPGFAWSNYGAAPLEMVLLHEMGHVFGTRHIDNTIMRKDIGDTILNFVRKVLPDSPYTEVNPLLLEIDQSEFLVFMPEQAWAVPMFPPGGSSAPDNNFQRSIIQEAYTALTGLVLQGPSFEVELDKPQGTRSTNGYWDLALFASTLTVKADGIESKLVFTPISHSQSYKDDDIAFDEGCVKQRHVSAMVYGILTRPDHQTKQVPLLFNSDGRVHVVDDPFDPAGYCAIYDRLKLPCYLLNVDSPSEKTLR